MVKQSVYLELRLDFEAARPFARKDVKHLADTVYDVLRWQADNTKEDLCPCDGYTTRIKIMYEGEEI